MPSDRSHPAHSDDPHVQVVPHFEFQPEPGPGQRWSTWSAVVKGAHGPQPRPDWVVTSDAALDTDLGVLKTGKEADVFLLERAIPGAAAVPGTSALMAAKRYRDSQHRNFHRDSGYLEGRTTRRSRDQRAVQNRTRYGRNVIAGQWAEAEFAALSTLWQRGLPVPYPVQIEGTELLLEFIGVGQEAAPRLAQTRPDPDRLHDYYHQITEVMRELAAMGQAHGDLSAYNILVHADRLVLIDLPQIVDVVSNPGGMEFLQRDCRTVCAWFTARGLSCDPEELFAELAGAVFGGW